MSMLRACPDVGADVGDVVSRCCVRCCVIVAFRCLILLLAVTVLALNALG